MANQYAQAAAVAKLTVGLDEGKREQVLDIVRELETTLAAVRAGRDLAIGLNGKVPARSGAPDARLEDRTVLEMHREAMDLASEAMLLYRRAYRLERECVDRVEAAGDQERMEPTFSILACSAASLALKGSLPGSAREMAERGLSGRPSPYIREQLQLIRSAVIILDDEDDRLKRTMDGQLVLGSQDGNDGRDD